LKLGSGWLELTATRTTTPAQELAAGNAADAPLFLLGAIGVVWEKMQRKTRGIMRKGSTAVHF
jgi:hypothetical protein